MVDSQETWSWTSYRIKGVDSSPVPVSNGASQVTRTVRLPYDSASTALIGFTDEYGGGGHNCAGVDNCQNKSMLSKSRNMIRRRRRRRESPPQPAAISTCADAC